LEQKLGSVSFVAGFFFSLVCSDSVIFGGAALGDMRETTTPSPSLKKGGELLLSAFFEFLCLKV
jgi:hypothetical protein